MEEQFTAGDLELSARKRHPQSSVVSQFGFTFVGSFLVTSYVYGPSTMMNGQHSRGLSAVTSPKLLLLSLSTYISI